MSMQYQEQPQAEVVSHRMIATNTIKKVADKISGSNPININLFLVVIISGIGELMGIDFSWQWYIFASAIIIIFSLDRFNILKGYRTEVIMKKEKDHSLD